jgi:hypothetical protein
MEVKMIKFIIGLILGQFTAILLMSLCSVAKDADDKSRRDKHGHESDDGQN